MLLGERESERLGDSNGSGKSKYKREIDTIRIFRKNNHPKHDKRNGRTAEIYTL